VNSCYQKKYFPSIHLFRKKLQYFFDKNIEKRWDEVILTKQCKEGRRKSFVKWEQCRKKPLRQQVVIPETAERFLRYLSVLVRICL